MRIAVGVLVCIALWSSGAAADTYYKYHDKRTGRDVYVNRLEQVPQKYRSQAQVVLEADQAAAKPDEPPGASAEAAAPSEQPLPPPPAQGTVRGNELADNLRKAVAGKNLLEDIPAAACTAIDLRLAASRARPMTNPERRDLASLFVTFLVAAILAILASLAAWIAVIVIAVRDERVWWALFVFIFSPVGYLYLLIHGGPGHLLRRILCALGMLSPFLVGAVAAWRFHAAIQAIMQARGIHI